MLMNMINSKFQLSFTGFEVSVNYALSIGLAAGKISSPYLIAARPNFNWYYGKKYQNKIEVDIVLLFTNPHHH